MTVDIPKLRKYVEWVEEQAALPVAKRKWYQKWWRTTTADEPSDNGYIVLSKNNKAALVNCGTLCCVAGKICEDEGLEFDGAWTVYQGEHMAIPHAAAKILGVDPSEAADLWSAGNRARDIRRYAERIAGERL